MSDEGARYRVSVTGEGTTAQKTYTDPGRECSRRIRFAAVFAILTLMPPELEPEPEPKPEPNLPPETETASGSTRSAPAGPSSSSKPGAAKAASQKGEASDRREDERPLESSSEANGAARVRPVVRFEVAGFGEQALGAGGEPRVRSLGVELRALLTRGEFAPLVTLGYAPAARLELGAVQVEVARAQASLGLRAHAELGPVDLGGELALLGALERIAGVGLEHPAQGSGFELGARAAALLSLASGRVGPMLAFHASVFPSPDTFEALPRGDAGHMPHLWLGLSAGMFWGL